MTENCGHKDKFWQTYSSIPKEDWDRIFGNDGPVEEPEYPEPPDDIDIISRANEVLRLLRRA